MVLGVDIFVVGMGIYGLEYVFMLGMLMVCLYISGIGVLLCFVYFIWSFVVIKFVFMMIVIIKDNINKIIIV